MTVSSSDGFGTQPTREDKKSNQNKNRIRIQIPSLGYHQSLSLDDQLSYLTPSLELIRHLALTCSDQLIFVVGTLVLEVETLSHVLVMISVLRGQYYFFFTENVYVEKFERHFHNFKKTSHSTQNFYVNEKYVGCSEISIKFCIKQKIVT